MSNNRVSPKNEQRILSGAVSQTDPPEWKAEIAALRSEVEELKKRVAALENP